MRSLELPPSFSMSERTAILIFLQSQTTKWGKRPFDVIYEQHIVVVCLKCIFEIGAEWMERNSEEAGLNQLSRNVFHSD